MTCISCWHLSLNVTLRPRALSHPSLRGMLWFKETVLLLFLKSAFFCPYNYSFRKYCKVHFMLYVVTAAIIFSNGLPPVWRFHWGRKERRPCFLIDSIVWLMAWVCPVYKRHLGFETGRDSSSCQTFTLLEENCFEMSHSFSMAWVPPRCWSSHLLVCLWSSWCYSNSV